MRIQSLQRVLFEDKKLVLTPFQINVLLGYSKPNAAGLVEYAVFAKKCHHLIDSMFTIEAMRRKAQFVQLGTFRRDQVTMDEYNDIELFKVFRNFDENQNGFLELGEYAECISRFEQLHLSDNEILTLSLACDVNGDGRIDYQEFMKHFKDLVYLIKFHHELQTMFDEEQKAMADKESHGDSPNRQEVELDV